MTALTLLETLARIFKDLCCVRKRTPDLTGKFVLSAEFVCENVSERGDAVIGLGVAK